jgi:hypothetical protein
VAATGLAAPINKPEHTSSKAYQAALLDLESRLRNVKDPDPFTLTGDRFDFGWCSTRPGRNSTLKDLATRLEKQSATARELAQLYAATGSRAAYRKSIQYLLSWATSSTLLNGYEMGMDPAKASFPGMEQGFCNRSWNMMLDSIWQAYGLINFSEAYNILNNSDLRSSHESDLYLARIWLKTRLVPAVNAGFHAWTKYADANPESGAFLRYRSDNHLSWSLAGLATAGLALNDSQLLDYVYFGTPYNDGISGIYENPSALVKLIPFAIRHDGKVYDEEERSNEQKGFFYGNFSLWAITIAALNTDKAGYPPLWTKQFSPESGSIAMALDRYAPFVSGSKPIKDKNETTQPGFFAFVYRLILNQSWVEGHRREIYRHAAMANESQNIRQGLGNIELITLSPKTLKESKHQSETSSK